MSYSADAADSSCSRLHGKAWRLGGSKSRSRADGQESQSLRRVSSTDSWVFPFLSRRAYCTASAVTGDLLEGGPKA